MDHGPRSERHALIIGGGIAGAVLALSLQRAGIASRIYEARSEPGDEAGFFLNLAPNGADVLDTLGIKDAVLGHGTPTTGIVFQNHRGKPLGANPEATTLIKRGLLNQGLRQAARERGLSIEFGKRLEDLEITRRRTVIARFADGSEARGDFVVGCDGIHSRTRRAILPDAPEPVYTGVIDSGAFACGRSVPPTDGVMRMTFGLKGFFGYQVVPSGEIYWFENYTQAAEPGRAALEAISNEQWRANLLERHRGDHDPIPEIINSTESRIGRWPIYDLPSLPTWHAGPVGLIGDAAHATSPHVGQGASLAMEDAIVLAKCLRDVPEPEEAFAVFERLRKDRVEKVVEQERRIGNHKAQVNAFARGIRDLVLPFFLKMGVKSTERLYAYRVDWDEEVA